MTRALRHYWTEGVGERVKYRGSYVGVEESLDQLELHIEGISRGKGARVRVQTVGHDR